MVHIPIVFGDCIIAFCILLKKKNVNICLFQLFFQVTRAQCLLRFIYTKKSFSKCTKTKNLAFFSEGTSSEYKGHGLHMPKALSFPVSTQKKKQGGLDVCLRGFAHLSRVFFVNLCETLYVYSHALPFVCSSDRIIIIFYYVYRGFCTTNFISFKKMCVRSFSFAFFWCPSMKWLRVI